ncbi:MAG: hypothetical protein R3D71_09020 [Rickettsiales bacterium]
MEQATPEIGRERSYRDVENPATNSSSSKDFAPVAGITHPEVSTKGKSAGDYAYEMMRLNQEQYKHQGKAPPPAVKWIGDASLAVLPMNRLDSAIGLLIGLLTFGSIANIATGRNLANGNAIAADKTPSFLKPIHGIVKNYNPKGLTSRDKWIKYAHVGFYSLGGLLGVKIGSDIAYKDVKEANKNPRYLEDYLTSVSHIQGDTWSWLSASSGVFGSASGTWAMPIPGINYGIGMVGRVTSMQDRNTMFKGLNDKTSGATTPSYLRLKEGAYYLAHHAVDNPAKDPTQIEYLAYTLLGPVFRDKLTADHIKQFTNAVHRVRDHYWQEGGIPKEKRTEALNTMKEVFTGAGLEVLLVNMGLNPATVAFDDINGWIGKIGNVGQKKEIKEKQEEYWSSLQNRLPKYVQAGIMTQERANWVKEGIEDMRHGKRQEALPPDYQEQTHLKIDDVITTHKDEFSKKPEMAGTVAEKLDIKPKTSLDKLLESAKGEGDFREKILKERQNMTSPRFVFE